MQYLTAGKTYYIRVRADKNQTGCYTLNVTDRIFASYVTINKKPITLEKGVLYELPITPNYTYKGYNGARRIPGLSVSIYPSNVDNNMVWWWEQYGSVLDCAYGWDDDDDRYIHLIASETGTAKLYAEDWPGNGRRDECAVNVDSMLIYRTRNRERLGFYDSSDNNDITPITAEDLTYGEKDTNTLVSNGTRISLRQHRTILTAQICCQIFRQTNQIDAGNSGSIAKEICAVWRKRCKKLCGQGASRELCGVALSDLTGYTSISQRVTVIKNFFNSQINYDGTFMQILSEMVDHFVDGTGTDYSNAALTAAVQSHQRTQSYVNGVIELIKQYISVNKGNINNLAYDESLWVKPLERAMHPLVNAMNTAISNGATELYLPSYGRKNGVPGLTLAIDGFYGNKIKIKSFQTYGNGYSGSVEFTFYDHFGLDTPDLTIPRFGNLTAGTLTGFKQWYILQHWSELEGEVQPKPFVTYVSFSVPISGTY